MFKYLKNLFNKTIDKDNTVESTKFDSVFKMMKERENEIAEIELYQEQKETNHRLRLVFEESMSKMKSKK